ncbi:hypothetical protein BC830DRAFT_361393 [Chytriomyces sp. MP71]|nr:hypothetical protein BC830DRAFT_361393 [Chytriomyces sp. MP71]
MSHSITLSPTASTRFHFRCDCWRRDPTLVRIKATTMAFQPALARRRAVEPVPMIHDEPHYIHVLHSMHSSYAELREFVRAVRPHAVHACVLDPGSAFTSVHVLSAFDDLVRPEERKVVPVEQAGAGVVAALLGRSKSRAEILLEQLAGLSSGEGDERQRVMTQSLEEDEETAPLESSMGSFGYVIDEAGVDTQRTRLMADKEIISLQNVQLATLARLKLPVEEEILKEPLDSNDVSLKQGSIHLLPGTPKDADLAQDDATEPMSSHPASIELGPIQNAGAPILSQPAESSAVSHIDPVESCEGDVFGESDDEAAASVVFDNNAREILEVIAPVHGMHLKVDADETEGTQPADPVSTLIPDSLEPQRKFALSKDEEMKILAYVDRASILIPDSLDSQRKSDWTDTRGTLESENLLAESSQKSDECIILDVHAPANTSQPCPLKEGSEHEDIIPSSQPASPASPASNSSSLVGQSVSRRVCDSAPSSPVLSVAQNSRKRQQPQSKELEVIDLTVSDEEETVLVLASPERPALLRRKRSGGESSSQAVKRVRSHESKCDPLDWVKGLSRQGSRLAAFSCDETQEGKLMETEVEERARHVRGGGRFVLACTNPFKENGS